METKLINRNKDSTSNGGSNHLSATKVMAPNGINNNNNNVISGNNEKSSALSKRLEDNDKHQSKSLLILGGIFSLSLMAMLYIYAMFPELEESEKQHLKIPLNIEDAKLLGRVLDNYKELYYFEVMGGLTIVYIFLQTFAIPGSLFLSILSGFLFKFPVALMLTCSCSALGATLCYLLSQLVGRKLVKHYFPKRAAEWAKQVEKHRDDILSYMLFLRMTPFLPNWFINLVAPVIGVPLKPFALGTFFGVAPPSFIAIQAGKTLYKMTSSSDAFNWASFSLLFGFSLIALVPVIFKRYFKSKIE